MGDDLGVGVAEEFDALGQKFAFEQRIVFDDAVVNESDRLLAFARDVGMSIGVGRWAVSRPTGVRDADTAGHGAVLEQFRQPADTAGVLPEVQGLARKSRQAGAVIAAIFQPAKSFQKQRSRFPMPDIANDSAHIHSLRGTRAKMQI